MQTNAQCYHGLVALNTLRLVSALDPWLVAVLEISPPHLERVPRA